MIPTCDPQLKIKVIDDTAFKWSRKIVFFVPKTITDYATDDQIIMMMCHQNSMATGKWVLLRVVEDRNAKGRLFYLGVDDTFLSELSNQGNLINISYTKVVVKLFK